MTPLIRGKTVDLKCGLRAYYNESEIYRFGFVAVYNSAKTPTIFKEAFMEVFGLEQFVGELARGLTLDGSLQGQVIWNQNGLAQVSAKRPWLHWINTAFVGFTFDRITVPDDVELVAHEATHLADCVQTWLGCEPGEMRGEPKAYLTGWLAGQLAYGAAFDKTRKGSK
jgi:hypothetical protein